MRSSEPAPLLSLRKDCLEFYLMATDLVHLSHPAKTWHFKIPAPVIHIVRDRFYINNLIWHLVRLLCRMTLFTGLRCEQKWSSQQNQQRSKNGVLTLILSWVESFWFSPTILAVRGFRRLWGSHLQASPNWPYVRIVLNYRIKCRSLWHQQYWCWRWSSLHECPLRWATPEWTGPATVRRILSHPLVPLLLAGSKGQAGLFTQFQGLHGAQHQAGWGHCHGAATEYYHHPRQQRVPWKERFQTPQAQPSIPCSPSLIKIERTHVPISHLLQGCWGVYASSLYTGTKFEYHLHLAGRQWI